MKDKFNITSHEIIIAVMGEVFTPAGYNSLKTRLLRLRSGGFLHPNKNNKLQHTLKYIQYLEEGVDFAQKGGRFFYSEKWYKKAVKMLMYDRRTKKNKRFHSRKYG